MYNIYIYAIPANIYCKTFEHIETRCVYRRLSHCSFITKYVKVSMFVICSGLRILTRFAKTDELICTKPSWHPIYN